MTQKIAILGAGPGGYVAAIRAAQLGGEVTLIEKEAVGGTCLNHGCIPSKIFKKTAEMLEDFQRAEEFGIATGTATCNFPKLLSRKSRVIAAQAQGIQKLLKKHRVNYITGTGYLTKLNFLTVTDTEGNTHAVQWDKLILATGSRPMNIPAFPFDGENILSSNDALSYSSIPDHVTIVGGGVIGCEFAFIWKSLGSEVTLIEGFDRLLPLPSIDEECSKVLAREMKKKKIKVYLKKTVEGVHTDKEGISVTIGPSPFVDDLKEKDKKIITEKSKQVIVCVGRKPNSDNIGLKNIGVAIDESGWVTVDETLQTTAENVYAIGDLLGPEKVMLAHIASTEGEIAAANCFGAGKKMNYEIIPGAIFTMPEIGNVGLSEAEAKDKFDNARADSVLFRTLGKAQVIGEIAGQVKIVSNSETGKILGVHITGPHATDLLAEATLAMNMGATVKDLAETIHAHPTLAETLLEASWKALDRELHA